MCFCCSFTLYRNPAAADPHSCFLFFFAFRYSDNGTVLYDTLTEGTTPNVLSGYDMNAKGDWQFYCEKIVVPSIVGVPVRFHVFIGRRLGSSLTPHTEGNAKVTMLSVEVYDQRGHTLEYPGYVDWYDEYASNTFRWSEANAEAGLLNNPHVSYLVFPKQGPLHKPTFTLHEPTLAAACCCCGTHGRITSAGIPWNLTRFRNASWAGGSNAQLPGAKLNSCYQSVLAPGVHTLTGCLTTGVFLQRPKDTLGGSCDHGQLCPADAAACVKDHTAGVLCYGKRLCFVLPLCYSRRYSPSPCFIVLTLFTPSIQWCNRMHR